jgi:autotransporter-associated beta strand protein
MMRKKSAVSCILLLTTIVASAQDPQDFYTRIGTDPTFQQLINSGVIVPGVSASPGPVLGSTINVNNTLLESQTGNLGNIPTDFRIHTQVNSSILRSNFPNFTRWYQEDGRIQVMRLFQGEQNVRSGVGPEGTPGRIEAFFPAFAVPANTWSVWEGTYTIIDPLQSNIFQLFHEGGQLWAFHLRMTNTGTIYFARRRDIAGLPTQITIASNMVGKSISFMVRANGTQYELYKRTPLPLQNWELVTTGSYSPAVDRKISYRWGMYYGSQAGQSIPNDGLLFVNGVKRSTVEAPGGEPPPPPPPVPMTYYWDNNGATAGFGSASGVWGETTSGGTQGWSTDTTGATLPEEVSTNSVDTLFFGGNTSGLGLGAGTITVSDTVDCADIRFGSQSGNITLNGGEIEMFGNRTLTVGGTGKTHTIRSVLSGSGSRTLAGGSTLSLTGENTFTGPLSIGDNTSSSLRLRISSITDANGTASAAGAPANATDGIIQIGSVSYSSTLEFTNATAAQSTNRRIRIGSSSNGSGSATIQNNNSNPEYTLSFTNSSFNTAATGISSTNRSLTLGGTNTGENTIQGAIIDNTGSGDWGKISLSKSGSGTWVLNGANSYTGNTSISGGLLRARITQTSSALSTSSVSVSSSATLVLDNRSTTNVANLPTIGNTFTGSGLLRMQFAAGTTARNTYLPNVTGFSGTIQLSNTGTTGDKWNVADLGSVTASLAIDSGSTIYLRSGTNTFTGGITLNGAGNNEGRGAIRLAGSTTVLAGDISLQSDATIGMENAAAKITGNITSGAEGTQTLRLGGTQGSQAGGTLGGNIGGGSGTIHLTVANGNYTLTGINTYTGNTAVNQGTLQLAANAQLRFVLGTDSGLNNNLSGAGNVILNGDFAIDTTAADALVSGTWVLENVTNLSGPYGSTFRVVGFEDIGNNQWRKSLNSNKSYVFDETTGTLTLATTAGYAPWAEANAGGQGPELDFDNDGVPNGIEFFLNAAPGFTALPTLDATHTITWTNGGNIPASTYGTQFVVQTSDNLAHWSNVPLAGLAANTDGPGGSLAYTHTGSSPMFVRLKVMPE